MRKIDEEEFLKELNKYGYNFERFNDVKSIYKEDKVLIPILIKYLDETEDYEDKEYLVRCLSKKGYKEITGKLLEEYNSSSNRHYKWAIGNALYEIRDDRYIDEYIKIVNDTSNGSTRQMIVLLLGIVKNDKAKQALLELLHDEHITPHVIDALSRYQDKSLIHHIEYFLSEENERKWITKIEKLKKENPNNIEYAYIESKAAWKHIKKQTEKAIKRIQKSSGK